MFTKCINDFLAVSKETQEWMLKIMRLASVGTRCMFVGKDQISEKTITELKKSGLLIMETTNDDGVQGYNISW
jgi:hypothetical protein